MGPSSSAVSSHAERTIISQRIVTGGSEVSLQPPTSPLLPPPDPAACLSIGEATQLLAAAFGEVDGVSVDYCDGMIAVGGPSDFWAVWRRGSGAWVLQFYTFSGSELCSILAAEDPNNSFGGWC